MYYILNDYGVVAEFGTEEEALAWFDKHPDVEDVWYCSDED